MGRFYIGIDGGGTKTGGALVDGSGAVLATCQAGPSCIVGAPSAEAGAVLRGVQARLCELGRIRVRDVARIGLGLSGIDFDDEVRLQQRALARALEIEPRRLGLVNDAIAALWGATPAPAAAILQHGTAYTGAWRAGHGREELFDHLDVGRCYDLRAEAVMLVGRMIDGRAEATSLRDRFLACLRKPARRYAETVYRRRFTTAQWNRLLPLVYAAAEDDDPAAQALVRRAVADYACTASAMIRRTGSAVPDVVFGGGRIRLAPEWFWRRLARAVRRDWPRATVRRPELAPWIGAAIMAAFADGVPPQRFFGKGQA